MKDSLILTVLLASAACASAPEEPPSELPPSGMVAAPTAAGAAPVMAAPDPPFVVIHGAWGGGWAWGPVAELLRQRGGVMHRPTLTGLGERVHLATPQTDLSTHITDVVNHLVFERLEDVVLVGHSYGGMVAIGVADRVPERIRRVVLLDAFLPENGESALTASRGTRLESLIGGAVAAAEQGRMVPAWTNPDDPWPTDVPQPVRTFTEPLRLMNPAADVPGTYILTAEPGAAPADDHFAAFAERAKQRGWKVVIMWADHNPQNSARTELAALLAEIGRRR